MPRLYVDPCLYLPRIEPGSCFLAIFELIRDPKNFTSSLYHALRPNARIGIAEDVTI